MYFSTHSTSGDPEDIVLDIVSKAITLPEDNHLDHIPSHVALAFNRETGNLGIAASNGEYATRILLPSITPNLVPYNALHMHGVDDPDTRVMMVEIEQLALQNDVGIVTITDVGGCPMIYHYNVTWSEALFMIDTALTILENNEDSTIDD